MPYDFELTWPLRTFTHDDGRRVEARIERCEIARVIVDADGDRAERRESFADSDAAERAMRVAAVDLTRDGFREVTPPRSPLASLDRCLSLWADEDPEFDAASLAARIQGCADPSPAEVFAQLERLADRWKARAEPGAWEHVFEPERQDAARAWLSARREQVTAALLLALRFGSYSVEIAVDALLCEDPRDEMWPAVLSVTLRPSPKTGGGRWSPGDIRRHLGRPPRSALTWLVQSLASRDFGVRHAARDLLVTRTQEPNVLASVWPVRDVSREAEESVVACLERLPDATARAWVTSLTKRWRKKVEKERLAKLLTKL